MCCVCHRLVRDFERVCVCVSTFVLVFDMCVFACLCLLFCLRIHLCLYLYVLYVLMCVYLFM